jgi:putative transposase
MRPELAVSHARGSGDIVEQARAWQSRPLEPFYGIVFLDALDVKIWHEGRAEERAACVALGINLEGRKDALGLWIAPEGSPSWFDVLAELRSRGVRDIYLICMDGLRGFPPGIESIYPKAQVQLGIAHMIRASLSYMTWPDRDKVVADLKPIYKAATADESERRRSQFGAKWPKYPAIARLFREQWEQVIRFYAFPEEVRTGL